MNLRNLFGLLLLLLLPACAHTLAASSAPAVAGVPDLHVDEERAVVVGVAEQVETHYVHGAKARTIAAQLRSDAARGAFDHNVNPRELAGVLTDRLKREDLHFRVSWEPPAAADAKERTAAQATMSDELRGKRFNQWFRKLEILPGNVGYIQLDEFADLDIQSGAGSPADSTAMRTADAALAFVQNTDALIFDLRDNGGGGEMTNYLLSHYLPPELVLGTMRGRTESTETRTLSRIGGLRRLDVPIYVLISGRTASAAEFFTYSLQMRKRATVVGEPSAGATNPYEDFEAGHGFVVSVSVAEPIDALSGTNWENGGV
ncbi:MAG TPA: S41 family peptidase, partial [Polyangiaceae bacterium]|nr:S41 family peptidase [Polyangiaceae bacterium]